MSESDKGEGRRRWSAPELHKIPLTDEQLAEVRDSEDPHSALRNLIVAQRQPPVDGATRELAERSEQEIAVAVQNGLNRCRALLEQYRETFNSGGTDDPASPTVSG